MKSEIEAKLKVISHDRVKEKLAQLGAEFIEEQKQTDTYFDNPKGRAVKEDKCLRIRTQQAGLLVKAFMTYKGPKKPTFFKTRQEIEFQVDDPYSAQQLLSALGYQPGQVVEKTRQLWQFENCQVALDDLTELGTFVEIEGPDEQKIADVQKKLDLGDLQHIPESYAFLINKKNSRTNKQFSSLNCIELKPQKGYIAYIVNPKAGASSHKMLSRKFGMYLAGRGFDVRFNLTTSLAHACELAAAAAIDTDCQLVVAVGGDGIVREVMHGLKGSDKPLLIVPAGTENLLANELGFDERLKTIIGAFEQGYVRQMDLGCANGKCFTSIAGFGFDGQVVREVTAHRKGHMDHFDYFWPIWRTFWKYKFPPMKVEVDGQEIFNGPCLVFIGNISRYAIGLQILRYADYDDGMLDVCIYKCANHFSLAKHSIMTVIKRHSSGKGLIYRQGRNFKITSSAANIAAEIDGDPGPALPVEIKVIPKAVKVIVPLNGKPAGLRTRIIRAIG